MNTDHLLYTRLILLWASWITSQVDCCF